MLDILTVYGYLLPANLTPYGTSATSPRERTMKAVVQTGYGDPAKVLRLTELDKPLPSEDQVLVRVVASSVNSGDWRKVIGDPAWARPMMGGLRRPKDDRLGGDVAGIAEAVGTTVTHVKPGDEVFGIRTGAFAEYVCGKNMVLKPRNLSFGQAAALPIAALTALQGLRDHGRLRPGERVLIHGAGGGVGHLAVQVAKALGAEVTATTRSEKQDLVRASGADFVIDYSREDFRRGGRRFDLVVDMGSRTPLSELRSVLVRDGRFVQIGAAKGIGGPFGRIISSAVRSRMLRQPVTFFIAKVNVPDLEAVRRLAEEGKLKPMIERTYRLDEITEAVAYGATERVRGKLALTIWEDRIAPASDAGGQRDQSQVRSGAATVSFAASAADGSRDGRRSLRASTAEIGLDGSVAYRSDSRR